MRHVHIYVINSTYHKLENLVGEIYHSFFQYNYSLFQTLHHLLIWFTNQILLHNVNLFLLAVQYYVVESVA